MWLSFLNFLVNGGWLDGNFTSCSTNCGNGTKSKLMLCDNPKPVGGSLCPCDDTDPNEIRCNGTEKVIERPCSMPCK